MPLSTLAFATLPPHLRPEGSSVYTLIRNLGSSVGISIMNALVVANTQTMHASLAAKIVPSDPVVRADPAADFDPGDHRRRSPPSTARSPARRRWSPTSTTSD